MHYEAQLFSPGTPVSSTNKTDHHDIWNNKCSNKAECDNGTSLKVTNQTDPSMKKLGHRQ
jgi:hypothetical protein